MTQTELATTITNLISKLDENLKETVNNTTSVITETDAKFEKNRKIARALVTPDQREFIKLCEQDKKTPSFKQSYYECLEDMSTNNKASTNFETEKTELEETMKVKMDEFKSETSSFIDMKLLTINSNKSHSYYDQSSADLIKWQLFNTP